MCGVSPVERSSGEQQRRRCNRGGDRQANAALCRIVQSVLRRDPRTQEYLKRRTSEGKTRPEVISCLRRRVARDLRGVHRAAGCGRVVTPLYNGLVK
ncbi:IS110 family transposase [Streptomyces sp. NBC_00879]|uniref:transposase n=1 Tax=Streptomyces sp. NBC_00879 TaxID=2975855 RepID=UPI00386E6467|nr:IS110 family transposase [Streptomyces sp. NBC_00879]